MKINNEKIDYIEIFKSAWRMIWQNKFLWWIGLVVFFGGEELCVGVEKFIFRSGLGEGRFIADLSEVVYFISGHQKWSVIIFTAISILFVLGIWGKGSLIYSLKEIEKKRKINFYLGMQGGGNFFWKLVGLNILIKGSLLIIFTALFIPSVFLLLRDRQAIGGLLFFIAGVIFFFIAILAYSVLQYGQLYVVLGKLRVIDSLERSYELFRRNIVPSFLMSTLSIFVIFLIVTLVFFASFSSLIPLGILKIIAQLVLLSNAEVMLIIFLWTFLVFAIVLIARAIYESFFQATWFLFFEKISKTKKENEVSVNEEEIIKEGIIKTEGIKVIDN